MNDSQGGSKPSDPYEAMREMRDAYLDVLSKSMIDAVNSESYAQANGAMLETYLAFATPIRESLDKAMQLWLDQMSLPSRQDIAALAGRFTHIEMRLDDMDGKLDRIVELVTAASKVAAPLQEQMPPGPAESSTAAKGAATARGKQSKAASEAPPRRLGARKG